MASKADVHALYQQAVQCVEAEIDFVDETFTSMRGRKARLLREDFCGTANTACEWVRRRAGNRAIAVDLDPDVLEWGRTHNVANLGAAAERITLVQGDVLRVRTEPVDAVLAHNFSYWLLKERRLMRRYFRRVRESLKPGGLFFLDGYGGADAHREVRERTKNKRFTYIWEQASFNPINHDMLCHIHFKFPDGSRIQRAFSYSWRLWSLPEIRELLQEAGFSRSTVYWQGTDEESGEGDGVFEPTEKGEADDAWIVYMVAE
jgi:SAM-dependent methyltransferase